jgi:hypothetical protein
MARQNKSNECMQANYLKQKVFDDVQTLSDEATFRSLCVDRIVNVSGFLQLYRRRRGSVRSFVRSLDTDDNTQNYFPILIVTYI